MWRNYIKACKTWKGVQSTFFVEFKNLDKPNDHMQCGVEIKWVWLYGVSNIWVDW